MNTEEYGELENEELEANASCPECGKEYILEEHGYYKCDDCKSYFYFPQDMRLCPYCRSEIYASARKCAHCGEWIDKNKYKSRTTYLLLTFFFGNLGFGEFYLGNYIAGFIYLLLSLASVFAPGFLLFIWIFAFLSAVRSDFGLTEKQAKKRKLIWNIAMLAFAIPCLAFAIYIFVKYWPK